MMKVVNTELKEIPVFGYHCDNCQVVLTHGDCATLRVQPGYPHTWADCESFDFCSDQCLVDFFIAGIKKHGGWKQE